MIWNQPFDFPGRAQFSFWSAPLPQPDSKNSWLGFKNQKVGFKSCPTFEDQLFFGEKKLVSNHGLPSRTNFFLVKKIWYQIMAYLRGPTFQKAFKTVRKNSWKPALVNAYLRGNQLFKHSLKQQKKQPNTKQSIEKPTFSFSRSRIHPKKTFFFKWF